MPSTLPLDTDVAIETPEHIVFRHRAAGPARRFIAYLIDLVLCYGALALAGVLITIAASGIRAVTEAADGLESTGIGLLLLVLFAIQWVYFAVFEAWRGRTPGKAALGLRVVTEAGRPIGIRAAALRNVMRAADSLPLTYTAGLLSIAGLTSMVGTRRFQRLGDLVAGTIVVVHERPRVAQPLLLFPPALPEELARMSGEVRLGAEERRAIELLLRRRSRLSAARQVELASMIAPRLAARFGLRNDDPVRTLALLFDRAQRAGRSDPPPSSDVPRPWR